jgi:hypothetical protein
MTQTRRTFSHALAEALLAATVGSIIVAGPVASASVQTKATVIAEGRAPDSYDTVAQPPETYPYADRWLKFEKEYGIQQESPDWISRMIQSAQYRLDTLAFTAQETARRLEFTYDLGEKPPDSPDVEPVRQYAVPLFGNFGHAQIHSVVSQHDPQTGAPFVGVKLSIPFGR